MSSTYRFARPVVVTLMAFCLVASAIAFGEAITPKPLCTAKRIAIVTGAKSTPPELKAAEMMQKRMLKRSGVTVDSSREGTALPTADVTFVVGTPEGNGLAKQLAKDFGAVFPTLPNSMTLHPEGFAVKSGVKDGKNYVVIAGVDERGTLYGVGWMLRAMTYRPDTIVVPVVSMTDKPALPIRGGRASAPGSRAGQYGKLRQRTGDEITEDLEDLMLLGTNLYEMKPDYIHATYGMLTVLGTTSNELPGGFPKEWGADGGRLTKLVCVSVPEARKALLDRYDKVFREAPDYDYLITNSGDTAGCRCEKCEPWGATYIKLVHDMADLLHKYHPNTKVLATNQDLTNEGNQAIFNYLNAHDSSWLYALHPGPGSDEMQTYIRGPVNPRWFEYEGFGPLGNFLKYSYHQLPRNVTLVLFSDITHWMQSQYGVPHPDVALAAVYDRRSWNARPRNFQKVGQEIFHYGIGDMHYTEGMHDDFNKWFWYRFMWNPNQSAEAITREYCRYWFGHDAEDEMTQAIFIMEDTLEKPVLGNAGIEKAVELVRSAGKKIPVNLLKNDWRWRVITEKALMDRYIQMELEHGEELKKDAAKALSDADTASRASFEKALNALDRPSETDAMKAIRDEAKQRGEESNTTIGYREPVVFIVDKLDLTEVDWWKDTLSTALASGDDARMKNTARMVLHYDDAGKGGFYDDVGWPAESQHLVSGQTLWGFRPFPGPSKHSQWNMAYGGRKDPVTFVYKDLDPQAQYVVRVSVGAPMRARSASSPGGGAAPAPPQATEHLVINGAPVGEPFPIPTDRVAFHEFEIPKTATHDGTLTIVVDAGSENLRGATVSEIWLMQKENMPWTAR